MLSSSSVLRVNAAMALVAPEDDQILRETLLREFGGGVEEVVIAVYIKR